MQGKSAIRQQILEVALKWIADSEGIDYEEYMATLRYWRGFVQDEKFLPEFFASTFSSLYDEKADAASGREQSFVGEMAIRFKHRQVIDRRRPSDFKHRGNDLSLRELAGCDREPSFLFDLLEKRNRTIVI